MRKTLLVLVAMAAGALVGCTHDENHAANSSVEANSVQTTSVNTDNFVCFMILGEPTPDQFNAFATLVRQYPPTAGHAISAGYKREAAVSVAFSSDEDPNAWINALPDALRNHEIVRSVTVEEHDCGEVKA